MSYYSRFWGKGTDKKRLYEEFAYAKLKRNKQDQLNT